MTQEHGSPPPIPPPPGSAVVPSPPGAWPVAGQPLPAPGAAYPTSPPYGPRITNGFAIASLIVGIVWMWWIGSILALIFGFIARSQIKASRGWQTGDGLAIAGIVLGFVGMAGLIVVIIVAVSQAHFTY